MATEVLHDHDVEWYLREVIAGPPGYRNRAGVARRDFDVPTSKLAVGDVLMMDYSPGDSPSFPAKLVERRWEVGTLRMVVVAVPAFEFDPVPLLVPADEPYTAFDMELDGDMG